MLSIGIVGLPNVGKSTLFNALTNNNILAANYPFATIEPNTGVVPIPDRRLSELSALYDNAPIKPAAVTFVDIAGLVAGASEGEGLGNQFLANIRSCDAICHVVRAFNDPDVQHVSNQPHPQKDISIINTELILADLQTVEKRLPKLEKEFRTNPHLRSEADAADNAKSALNEGIPLIEIQAKFNQEQWQWLQRELQLLTMKPVIYLFNVDETSLADEKQQSTLAKFVVGRQSLLISAKLEAELNSLDRSDRRELLKSYGVDESGLIKLIHAAYDILGLQSYLTAGKKEVRAWTIPKGATAPQAAGVIHGDFERGFIAAEVVNYHDLLAAGSLIRAKTVGKVRTEGKTYVMQPDDVVEFRFNI